MTFLQIKRLTGQQAAIGRGTGAAAQAPPRGAAAAAPPWATGAPAGATTMPLPTSGEAPAPGVGVPGAGPPWGPAGWSPGALPDVSEVLDEAFGKRHD